MIEKVRKGILRSNSEKYQNYKEKEKDKREYFA